MKLDLVLLLLFSLVLQSTVTAKAAPTGSCLDIPPELRGYRGTYEHSGPWTSGYKVDYAICDTINTTCGVNPGNKCADKDRDCCSVCQRWQDEDGTWQGACLGKLLLYSVAVNEEHFIQTLNSGGDEVDVPPYPWGQRTTYINIICGKGNPFQITSFISPDPSVHTAGTDYPYYIQGTSKYVC